MGLPRGEPEAWPNTPCGPPCQTEAPRGLGLALHGSPPDFTRWWTSLSRKEPAGTSEMAMTSGAGRRHADSVACLPRALPGA